jgi:Ca2+-binding EF-hand superfamily protein
LEYSKCTAAVIANVAFIAAYSGLAKKKNQLERAKKAASHTVKIVDAKSLKNKLLQQFSQRGSSQKGALKVFNLLLMRSSAGDSQIDLKTFHKFVNQQHGLQVEPSAVDQVFREIDVNDTGLVELDEFAKYFFGERESTGHDYYERHSKDHIRESKLANVRNYAAQTKLAGNPMDVFHRQIEKLQGNAVGPRAAFRKLLKLRPSDITKGDKNMMSRNDFISIMMRMQVAISVADLHKVFDILDADNNGSVEFDEFIKYFQKGPQAQVKNSTLLGPLPSSKKLAQESKHQSGTKLDGEMVNLVNTIKRALSVDFMGYHTEMQTMLAQYPSSEPVTFEVLLKLFALLNVKASSRTAQLLHNRVLTHMSSNMDHQMYIPALMAACGTNYGELLTNTQNSSSRPQSSLRSRPSSGRQGSPDALLWAMQNPNIVGAVRKLKRGIEKSQGGNRETMPRLVRNLKQRARFKRPSSKLTDCDITMRQLVRAVQDAGVQADADLIRGIFAGLDTFTTGRIDCAAFLQLIKAVPTKVVYAQAAQNALPRNGMLSVSNASAKNTARVARLGAKLIAKNANQGSRKNRRSYNARLRQTLKEAQRAAIMQRHRNEMIRKRNALRSSQFSTARSFHPTGTRNQR